jgi:class 3 adenylate cyclase
VEKMEIKKVMKKKSRPRLYLWLVILASVTLSVTLTITSLKIIRGGKSFTEVINEENKIFVVNTVRFGHGVMAHMGSETYDSLIDLALKSKFILFLAILDEDGNIIAQSDPPGGLRLLKTYDVLELKDGKILEKTKSINLISYKAKRELVSTEEHMTHHATFMKSKPAMMGQHKDAPKPGWFLVGMDGSLFTRHYRDMVIQTVGTGAVFLFIGILIIVFLGMIQRYELANLSIERLLKIKRVLSRFVPQTAKNVIEKDPEKKGLLDKYIQDASVLFLDIEGFTLLQEQYSQETINRTIEFYFSLFFKLIQNKGGDINETAGDGMMVIFLDSDPIKHAQNAVKTALNIQEQCRQLSTDNDPDKFSIKVNIGIHSGKVYLGSTKMRGSEEERWTFTASGPVTILAARLSDYAQNGQILLGEETARRVEKDYPLNSIGKIPLKNIKDPVEIYEVSSLSLSD